MSRQIAAYLRAHPDATDTVEGILDWWLPVQRYEDAKTDVQQALRDLVQQGLIEEVAHYSGNRLYRLASPREKSN